MFGGRNCTGVLAPPYLSFFTASASLVLFFVTVAGNSLVCLAVVIDPNRQLRKPFNFLVVNLAAADLVVGLILVPISVVIHLKEGLTDGPLGKGIPTIHMAYFISCTASVLSLAALSIDRYIAVAKPFYYRTQYTVRNAITASVMIWTVSISLPFVYFKVGYIAYAFVFVNTAVVLTFAIVAVSYARIYRRVKRQLLVSARLQQHAQENLRVQTQKSEARMTKVFMLVLAAYLMCYMPSCVMIYVMNFCLSCSCYSIHWLRDMQFVLVLLNSCLNPFLYAWRLSTFRDAFAALMRLPSARTRTNSATTRTPATAGSTVSLNKLNAQACVPKIDCARSTAII